MLGAAAEGVAKAAKLLAGQYTLVATNVPYLKRSETGLDTKRLSVNATIPEAKDDLGDCLRSSVVDVLTASAGTCALVTPQNWLFLVSYRHLRAELLDTAEVEPC